MNLKLDVKRPKTVPLQVTSRELTPEKLKRIDRNMILTDWNSIHQLNVNEGYADISDKINTNLDELAPYKTRTVAPGNIITEPWMTKCLLKSSKKCHKLYKKSIDKPKNDQPLIRYKKYQNAFNRLKLHSKRTYVMDKIKRAKMIQRKSGPQHII